MIAAAALSARGIVPEMMIDLALLGPYFINMPLAPAEGLIVVNSGYEGNSNGQVSIQLPQHLNILYLQKYKKVKLCSYICDDLMFKND